MGNLTARILRTSILACVCIPAYALAEVHLGFDRSIYSTSPGGAVQVQVRIDGLGDSVAPSLGSFDFSVAYDPAILSFTGATFGDPILGSQLNLEGHANLPSSIVTTPAAVELSLVSFDSANTLDTQQQGAFTLATISFSALTARSSPLAISILSLADSQGDPLGATLSGATVVVPEPRAMVILMIGMLVMMGWAARRRMDRSPPFSL